MSYRLIDSNAIAIKYPEVNEMPCVYADLPEGLNGQFIDAQPEPSQVARDIATIIENEKDMRVIASAQPDLDEWCADCKEYDSERHCCPRFNRVIRDAVEEAKGERKTGNWIDTGSGQECSVCGEIQYGYDNGRKFCPNCGADMRGAES